MKKPDSLRAYLTGAYEVLQRDSDRLQMFIDKGSMVATGTRTLSYEFRYTLTIALLDWTEELAGLSALLVAWLSQNQREALQSFDLQNDALRFEADLLDGDKVDLQVEIPLTERVKVTLHPDGRLETAYLDEPPIPEEENPLFLGPAPLPLTALRLNGDLAATWPQP